MMRAIAKATKAEAEALIAQIDAERGFPRTEVGIRVGGGRHVDTITTVTDTVPVRLKDGTWAVRADRLALAGLATTGERDVKADIDDAAPLEIAKP